MWIGRYYLERWMLAVSGLVVVAVVGGGIFTFLSSRGQDDQAGTAAPVAAPTAPAPSAPVSSAPATAAPPASPTAVPAPPQPAASPTAPAVTAPPASGEPATTASAAPTEPGPVGTVTPAGTEVEGRGPDWCGNCIVPSPTATAPNTSPTQAPQPSNVPRPSTSGGTDYIVTVPTDGTPEARVSVLAIAVYEMAKKLASTQFREPPGVPLPSDISGIAGATGNPAVTWVAAESKLTITDGSVSASRYVCVTGPSVTACPK